MKKNRPRPTPEEDEEAVLLLLTGVGYFFGGCCVVFAFLFGVLEGEAMAWGPIIFGVLWIFATYQWYRLMKVIGS